MPSCRARTTAVARAAGATLGGGMSWCQSSSRGPTSALTTRIGRSSARRLCASERPAAWAAELAPKEGLAASAWADRMLTQAQAPNGPSAARARKAGPNAWARRIGPKKPASISAWAVMRSGLLMMPPGRICRAVLTRMSTRPPSEPASWRTLVVSVMSSGTSSPGRSDWPGKGLHGSAMPTKTCEAPAARKARAMAWPNAVRPSVIRMRRWSGLQLISWLSLSSGVSCSGSASMTPWPDLSRRNAIRTRWPGLTASCRWAIAEGPQSSATVPTRQGVRARKYGSAEMCTRVAASRVAPVGASRQTRRADRQR
jgi:hypothetical protein